MILADGIRGAIKQGHRGSFEPLLDRVLSLEGARGDLARRSLERVGGARPDLGERGHALERGGVERDALDVREDDLPFGAVALESGAAMMGKLPEFNGIVMDFWFRQLWRSTSSGLALAACRSVPAAAAVGVRAAEAMFSYIISAGIRLTRSIQYATDAGLKPIHRVASANAARLGRAAAHAA